MHGKPSILVSGAAGFVGTALCAALRARGHRVVGAVRQGAGPGQVNVGDLGGATDWRAALAGCQVVIHRAARVHVMRDASADPLAAYRAVNRDATLQLARQAGLQGVRRLVYVSSVKVHGQSSGAAPFGAHQRPLPDDPYGRSKLEAEQGLRELGRQSGLELVVVRPPLVYGPGVRANFADLMRLVKLGIPLPFGRVGNRRSMVALENLVDLLIVCAGHAGAPGHTFMVSDGADLNIGQLATMIGTAMGRRVLLLPVPVGLMRAAAAVAGKAALAERLFGALQVDIGATRATLGWAPPVSAQAAIERTVAHFMAGQRA